VVIEPVSANRLHENGNFCGLAGDFRQILAKVAIFRRLETWDNAQKADKMRQFRRVRAYSFWLSEWLAGAGGFEPRYGELDSDALACPRGVAEPIFC
jgi:hypothetical protein